MANKYKNGEMLILYWDGYPGYEIIKGAVELAEAKAAVVKEFGEDAGSNIIDVEHKYGFWGMGIDDSGEPAQFLYERDERGRGRFPITLAKTKDGDRPNYS